MKFFIKYKTPPGGHQWCKKFYTFYLIPPSTKLEGIGSLMYKILKVMRIHFTCLSVDRYGDYARVTFSNGFSVKFGVQFKWLRHKAWAEKLAEYEKRAEARLQSGAV